MLFRSQLSTGADYRFRTTEGPPEEWVARLTGRYLAEVMRTGTRRPWVRRRLAEVIHMIRPPSALFGPGVLARLACDRLAGVTGADLRRVGDHRDGSDGGPRPPRRPTWMLLPPLPGGGLSGLGEQHVNPPERR